MRRITTPGRPSLAIATLLAGLSLTACNALTGIDDLTVGKDGPSGGSSGDGGGSSGDGGAGPVGSGNGSSTGPEVPPDPLVDAQGVSITEIALFQGVKRPLMQDGAPASSKTPVVAGRDGLLRVYFATDGAYDGSPVTARLFLGADPPIEIVAPLAGASTDGALGSTINFELLGAAIAPGQTFRVELKQPQSHAPAPSPAASWPASGTSPLPATPDGPVLKVRIVPIAYAADGSNRLPDTSPAQLKAYEEQFYAMYPVPAVEISTHAPVTWNQTVSPNGAGWGELLNALGNYRAQENVPDDVYYFGAFAPTSSVGSFCGGGCVAGLGNIAGPGDSYARVAIGLGYSGAIATETAVHEIGHTHGRYHAPCGGAQGTDPSFPYSSAKLGVWGYDLLHKTLVDPNDARDVMGYCSPIWVSDYTFTALFDRIKTVNNAKMYYPPELLDRTYARALVKGDGTLAWMSPVTLHTPPSGEPTTLTVQSTKGDQKVTAQYYPYDHIAGGVVLWPEPASAFDAIELDLAGQVMKLEK